MKKIILVISVLTVMTLLAGGCASKSETGADTFNVGKKDVATNVVKPLKATQQYKVTVKNVDSTNILTPGVFVVHASSETLNLDKQAAPQEILGLGATGGQTALAAYYKVNASVKNVYTVDAEMLPGGESSFTLELPTNDPNVLLSGYAMVKGTEDGLVFLDRVGLFDATGNPVGSTTVAKNFDAKSEQNTVEVHPQLLNTVMQVVVELVN